MVQLVQARPRRVGATEAAREIIEASGDPYTTVIPFDPEGEPPAMDRCFACPGGRDVPAWQYRTHMAGHGISV